MLKYKLSHITTFSSRGLKGGGKQDKQKSWDYGRLAKAIRIMSERNITSKKDIWYAIAQIYFGEVRISKRKIHRLRTICRENCGNIREQVREFPVTVSEPDSMGSISKETSEMEIAAGLQKGEGVIYETGNADPKT